METNQKREPMIRIEDVVFRYYEQAKRNILDHTSLEIEEGKVTILMGSSGCGKSTLAAVSCGLLPENGGYLEQGEIWIDGKPLAELTADKRAKYVTMMFQNPDLQFCMDTLRKEMQFCMENIRVPREEMNQRLNSAAEELGMTALLDQKLFTLSGGEKQKAALCCLAVMESKCLILDEPFANLDAPSAKEIVELLVRMQKKRARTIVVIDHSLKYWLDIADEVILLGEGAKILAKGCHKGNLKQFATLFLQEGVFYPDDAKGEETGLLGERIFPVKLEKNAAIMLNRVTVTVQEKKSRWRRTGSERMLLKDITHTFPAGTMNAILGNSGCGKTTLFLSILNQQKFQGEILFEGEKRKKKELYQKVGIVFQNPANQFITQNVQEEVEASIRQWSPHLTLKECEEQARQLLAEYGLERYRRYSPYMLSQGQQRRLAVLSVLAGRQSILLLDEPTYGQDYRSTMAIMKQLAGKVQQEGLTVLFTTHDEELANEWADYIYRVAQHSLQEVKR